MTDKKETFTKKEGIDIAFSGFFLLLAVSYLGLAVIAEGEFGYIALAVMFIGIVLMISLVANILIQTILNIVSVNNKIKLYVFFVALNIDNIVCFYFLLSRGDAGDEIFRSFALLSFLFIFIKFLIAKYYYKTLNKYDQKRII